MRLTSRWSVTFHPAGEVHADSFHEGGARELNIEIKPARLQLYREFGTVPKYGVVLSGGAASWLAGRLYDEFRRIDELSTLTLEGLVIELLGEISRQHARQPRSDLPLWLCQVRELIGDRFAEPLTLGEIAGAVGVHPIHLAREFRRYFHCTVGQRIRELRVEHACRALSQSGNLVADIALAAGFAD